MFFKPKFLSYNDGELERVKTVITKIFGEYDSILTEIVPLAFHVDVAIVKPTKERPYYTLVTLGFGAYKINVPKQYNDMPKHYELVMYMPESWNPSDTSEENMWPIKLLKIIARMPYNYNSWICPYHTVSNGNKLASNIDFWGAYVDFAEALKDDSPLPVLDNKEIILFLQAYPLYKEELEYAYTKGTQELVELLNKKEVSSIVNTKRVNVCKN